MARHIRSPRLEGRSFRLGAWLVDPILGKISRGGVTVRLEPRAMDVLVHLAENSTELVTRRRLMAEVWGASEVSDNTLTRVISDLRRALDDDARNPRFVETIHRRGYRMLRVPQPVEPDRRRSWSARERSWSEASDSILH